jgi:hypothetical protein
MTPGRPSGEELVRALVRSARGDAPPPGARARALARLAEAQGSGLAGALVAAAVVVVVITGFVGRSTAPPHLAVSPVECNVGVEAPPGSCADGFGGSSSASNAFGGSSSGVAGSSGSSSG